MENVFYSDFDVFFRKNALNGDIIVKKNKEDIKQSLNLLFRTSFYDRKWHPEIGSRLMSILFMMNDTATRLLLKNEIETLITTYEPRITLQNIEVTTGKYKNLNESDVEISLEYTINSIQTNDVFSYVVRRTR